MAKKLKITLENEKGEKEIAEVPYATGKIDFGEEKNVYVGPDYGFSLRSIAIDAEEGRIHYGFADSVLLQDGKAEAKIDLKTGTYHLTFEVI